MSPSRSFMLNPLSRALRLLPFVPLLIICEQAQATRFIDGSLEPEASIDGTTGLDDYDVFNGATLNANGARTLRIIATGSTLNLTGTQVQGNSNNGMHLDSSTATIIGSNISSDRIGLVLSHDAANTKGSTALVQGSSITGARNGATVNGLSVLTLEGSTITGSSLAGIRMFNGAVNAIGSNITGATNGLQINTDPGVAAPNVVALSGSRVVGLNGAAILVDTQNAGTTQASIAVLNNSSLVGSNGILMDVRNGAEGNLQVGNSTLVGDIVADGSSAANVLLEDSATLTGRLQNVQNLGVNSNARWVMLGDGEVQNLTMNGGAIQFGNPGEFFKLNVGTLSGTGGTFHMHTDFRGQVDTLTVTGNATGNHTVAIDSSGSEPVGAGAVPVVNIGGGDATLTLEGGEVNLGAFSYDLIKLTDNGWFLNTASRVISPGTQSVIALFNAAPTAWYGELSTLRTRMGEVRMDHGKAGGWIRAYGNKFNIDASSGVAYQQVQQGLSFGADAPLPMGDGQWLVGVLGGYSKSDLDLSRGTSGTIDSYYLGAYTTWLDEPSGYYFDGVLKFNRFQNESDVHLSDGKKTKGNYDSHGAGASLEFGRHIKLADDYFVEPYAQLSGVIIQGKDYDLDNGLSAEGSRTHSLLAKGGATAGRNFKWGDDNVVQPYVRAAYVHEFANNNEVQVNDNSFNNDLSGSRGELGVGVAASLSDRVSIHADFDYSNGDKIEQPWGANVGVRYSW